MNAGALLRAVSGVMLVWVCLVIFSQHAAAADLERLFTTPGERARLDALRREGMPRAASVNPSAGQAPVQAEKPAPTIVLNGVLRRGDGDQVIWINGERADAGREQQGVRVRGADRDNRVTLDILEQERRVRMRPGQVWEPRSGRIEDRSAARGAAANGGG